MKSFKTKAGTELPMMDLRGKDYLLVAHRVQWFREEHPDWTIKTIVEPDFEKQRCVARAEIANTDGQLIASATKFEDIKGFGDYIEKSETGAIGRALALCGYGTQFAPELDEEDRIVDAPLPAKKPAPVVKTPASKEWHPGEMEQQDVLFMLKEVQMQVPQVKEWMKTKCNKNALDELTRAEYDALKMFINDGGIKA